MELSEIVAAIGQHVGGDKAKAKDVAEAIRADSSAKDVSQYLIDQGNAGKTKEVKPRIEKLEADLKTAQDAVAEKEAENAELKSKTPDAKTIEEKANAAWLKKYDAEKTKREAAEQSAIALRKEVAVEKFIDRLTSPDERGVKVKPAWARRVVASEHADRFVVRDDGAVDVLQIGETTAYDGKNLDEKIAALAADARKKIDPGELITSTDSGAGVGGGGGGGGTLTEDQLVERKRASGAYRGTF